MRWCVCVCGWVGVCVWVWVGVGVGVCERVCVYVCVWVYVCVRVFSHGPLNKLFLNGMKPKIGLIEQVENKFHQL